MEEIVKPIKTKIHQGHDPFLDFEPMAEDMQGWGSTDEAFALAAKILDINDALSLDNDIIKVVHLKPMIQNWPWPTEEVFDHVGFYFDLDGQLKIGNYQQLNILHYYKKEIITENGNRI